MYEHILLAFDRLPTGMPDFPDRRRSQLVAELCHLWPSARLTVFAFGLDHPHNGVEWLQGMGVEVILPPIDLRAWMESRRFEFGLVVLAGRSTQRLATDLRATQPQALLVADLDADDVDARSHADAALLHPEERLGERLVAGFERHRVEDAVATADAVLTDSHHASNRAKAFAFDGVLRPPPSPGQGHRTGGVVAARFAEEFGEPDEAGVEGLLASWPTTGESGLDCLRFCLRRPPPALRRRIGAVAPISFEALQLEVTSARVLVTVRPFGPLSHWHQRLALETGTPWVLLGPEPMPGAFHVTNTAELHRAVARFLEDDDAWLTAQRELIELATRHGPRESRAGLVSLLGSVGFMPPSDATLDGPPAPLGALARFTQLVDEPGSFQGQVRSAGWNEHRPMNPVMQRADLSPDFLFPHSGYAWWYEGHRLSSEAAEAIRQVAAAFAYKPLISIVMPVHNTDPEVLDDTISSVRDQLYRNWELCIADDASTSAATADVLERHAREDPRIRVQRMSRNGGISEASNTAAATATGEFIALLDHDDLLTPDALFEVVALLNRYPDLDFIYSDEDKLDEHGNTSTPFFKPSWSPELHLCLNYVTHLAVYRKALFDRVGGFRSEFDGSQDYDLSLRVTDLTERVGHIAKPIYTWRMVAGSAAISHDAKPYAVEAARRAVADALRRRGLGDQVDDGREAGTWRPRFPIFDRPKVSVLIPTRNGRKMLERCIDGVLEHTDYGPLELVIVDNGSDEPDTLEYLAGLDATVVRYPYRFNYARQMNLAAAAATGDLLLLLNNDVEILDPGWLEAMVEHGVRPEVGAVGARLVFPSGRPQHEGVFVGFGGGCAGNIDFGGYFHLGRLIRDCTAVTAACMLIRPGVLAGIGGFDERLRVAFNDVDLCLRLRQHGYRIVYTPYAELMHAESASRGGLHPDEDEARFIHRWGRRQEFDDPFYSPNLDPVRPFRLIR